jgi:Nucleotidyltransferase of unknown function (DUF6036)
MSSGAALTGLIEFLTELNEYLATSGKSAVLYVSGGAAVVFGYGGSDKTKDVDVISPAPKEVEDLADYAKKGSEVHGRTNLYLEIVLPIHPLASGARDRSKVVPLGLSHLEVRVLSAEDLIITKLQRYTSGDREDVQRLSRDPSFNPERLVELWEDARIDSMGEQILETMDERVNDILVSVGHPRQEHWSDDY